MKMIEIPINGDFLRLNWDRNKFSAIIPETSETSTLYYDGMKLQIGISASKFTSMMDSLENEDNIKAEIEMLMSTYVFHGEVFNELNAVQEKSHLQHTKWNTDILKVQEKDSIVKIQCRTYITSSFIVNHNGVQVTRSVQYTKDHTIDKCKTYQSIRKFIVDNLSKDLQNNVELYRTSKRRYTNSDIDYIYGLFYYFDIKDVSIPVYLDPNTYSNTVVDGVALNVELSRYGNIEQGRISNEHASIVAKSKLQAARIIALGPIICEKLLQAEAKRGYAKSLMINGPSATPFAQAQLDGAKSLERSANSILNTGYY